MAADITEDKTFTKVTAETIAGRNRTFENCKFLNSDFSYADFSNVVFVECYFEGCNLSLTRLSATGLQNIRFKDCKVSGADFSKAIDFLFEVHFENCILDNAVFLKRKIRPPGLLIAQW